VGFKPHVGQAGLETPVPAAPKASKDPSSLPAWLPGRAQGGLLLP